MTKKGRNRKHRGPNRSATRRHSAGPAAPSGPPSALEPLVGSLREALRDPDPIAFWAHATSIVVLVDEPGELADLLPDGMDLLQTFIEVDLAETTALLHMVAALSRDELTRARAQRAVRGRRQPVPPQVSGLAELTVTGTRVFGDVSGDNHLLGLSLPGEVRATLVSYVERSPRPYLKDAFFIPERLEIVQERFTQLMEAEGTGPDSAVRDVDPAQSRAALKQALAGVTEEQVKDPEPGDHWPMCRPLVEFVLGRLPEGGAGYDERGILIGQDSSHWLVGSDADWFGLGDTPWSDEDGTDLVAEFLASPHAQDLRQDEATSLLVATLLSLACLTEGDPLHWCQQTVRWVVQEALPSSPLLSDDSIVEAAQILPMLVSWAHEEEGTDPATRTIIQEEMSDLLTDLPQRWLDKEMEVARLDARTDLGLLQGTPAEVSRALIIQQVGGATALHKLGTDPLPPESLVLDDIAEDVHGMLREVDVLLEAALDRLQAEQLLRDDVVLGTEFRTACRRLLTQAAREEPEVLRGRATARTTAAAVAWVVGRGNRLVGNGAPVRTGDLMRAFDLKSPPSQRAQRLEAAARLPHAPFGVAMGSPDLLVASARRSIAAQRDRLDAGQQS